jgi:hypothetical protein
MTPANINPLHAAAIWQCNALAQGAAAFMINSPHREWLPAGVCLSSPFSTNVPGNAFFPSRSSRIGD